MAMFSTYIAWTLVTMGLPYWLAFFVTVIFAFVAGMLIERIVFRPLNDAPVFSVLVTFVGLFLAINALAGWIWGYLVKEFPAPVRGSWGFVSAARPHI